MELVLCSQYPPEVFGYFKYVLQVQIASCARRRTHCNDRDICFQDRLTIIGGSSDATPVMLLADDHVDVFFNNGWQARVDLFDLCFAYVNANYIVSVAGKAAKAYAADI